jgi:hypothetical protein
MTGIPIDVSKNTGHRGPKKRTGSDGVQTSERHHKRLATQSDAPPDGLEDVAVNDESEEDQSASDKSSGGKQGVVVERTSMLLFFLINLLTLSYGFSRIHF